MKASRSIGLLGAATLLAASALTAWASGPIQKAPREPIPQKAPAQLEKKLQLAPLKVEAHSLEVTVPPSTKPTTTLDAGARATITLTVRNTGTATVPRVFWSILAGDRSLAKGERTNVAPGATFTVTAPWTVLVGQERLRGEVVEGGTIAKGTVPAAARKELLVKIVGSAPAPSAPATSTAPAPALTSVTPGGVGGYSLRGTDLGLDRTTTLVFEGTTQVPADRVTVFGPDHVRVGRPLEGTVAHKVVVRGRDSNVLTFTHPALPAPAQARTITVASPGLTAVGRRGVTTTQPPALTQVTPGGVGGYSLRGTDLGLDRTTTLVFEGATQIPADRVTVFGPDHVRVSRPIEGTVAHKVVVRGQDSNVLSYTHPALPPPAQSRTINVAPPGLTATGRRGQ